MLVKNQVYEATVTDYTAEGQGVAHVQGCAVFLPNAIAGERVRLRIEKAQKTWAAGKIVEITKDHPVLMDQKSLYIDDLCVDENTRGRHVGSTLYDYAAHYAREIGCDTVPLNVWCGNDGAMAFYESRGLKPRNIHMEAKL